MQDSQIYQPDYIFVGGGPVNAEQLSYWADKGKALIAVDGGLNAIREAGLWPSYVLGDLDSAAPAHLADCRAAGIECQFHDDQNSTDLEKALRTYPEGLIVGLGFLDGRMDHALAALHGLIKAGGAGRVLLIGASDALMVAKGLVRFNLPAGRRVSIVPLTPVSFARSAGLTWALDGLEMEIGQQGGTSNAASGGDVVIDPANDSAGYYALMLAARDWPAIYQALTQTD